MDPREIVHAVSEATGQAIQPRRVAPSGGGCINEAYIVEAEQGAFFVKFNRSERVAMFAAEQESLEAIDATNTVRVPRVYGHGRIGPNAHIVMEALPLNQRGCSATLGEQLAEMHRRTQPRFGFTGDGFIGSTPQINTPSDSWPHFFRRHRLGYQLDLARQNGASGALLGQGEALLERVDRFFAGYEPAPSLLHGDLWGGNHAFLDDGTPVIFDPACYWGDREADLAMTELFGGFDMDFYDAYRATWPLDSGYRIRRDLYNLYHVLNHFNLFGGSYGSQAARMIDRLLAEVGS
ncbi:MAG: fructosamine kinase family protein [Halothiobacillaceae bacterium]